VVAGGGDVWDRLLTTTRRTVEYGTAGASPQVFFGDRANMKVGGNACLPVASSRSGDTGDTSGTIRRASTPDEFHIVVADLLSAVRRRHSS